MQLRMSMRWEMRKYPLFISRKGLWISDSICLNFLPQKITNCEKSCYYFYMAWNSPSCVGLSLNKQTSLYLPKNLLIIKIKFNQPQLSPKQNYTNIYMTHIYMGYLKLITLIREKTRLKLEIQVFQKAQTLRRKKLQIEL